MEKTKVYTILLLVLYLSTACSSTNLINDNIDKQVQEVEQTALAEGSKIVDSNGFDTNNKSNTSFELREESYSFIKKDGSSYSVSYARLSEFMDEKLAEKINSSLKSAMIEWINDYSEWAEKIQLKHEFKNKEFLSLLYVGEFESPSENDYTVNYIQLGIIINLKTGERVFLNDVIDDESLKISLLEYNVENSIDAIISEEEADEIIKYASMSEKEYIDEIMKSDTRAEKFMMSYLMSKPTIYLKKDKIVITRGKGLLGEVMLDSSEWLQMD